MALLLAAAPAAQAVRVPPVDQCAADASFVAFRDELRRIVARRERDALLGLLSDEVTVDFGGGAGRADFVAAWRLDQPAQSPLWDALGEALALGCARDRDELVSPAMFVQLPATADPFETLVAVAPEAKLRAAPQAGAPVLAALDWHVLQILGGDREEWVPVSLSDGRRGFVRRAETRSAIDYRAHFRKTAAGWRIVSFVAGD